MGVVTCQRQRHRVQPSPIRVRDFLYVSHGENRQMLVAVRVNGYFNPNASYGLSGPVTYIYPPAR